MFKYGCTHTQNTALTLNISLIILALIRNNFLSTEEEQTLQQHYLLMNVFFSSPCVLMYLFSPFTSSESTVEKVTMLLGPHHNRNLCLDKDFNKLCIYITLLSSTEDPVGFVLRLRLCGADTAPDCSE